MSSNNLAPPPSSTSSMPNSEASSNDQNTTKIGISSSSSSVNPPPTSPTSDGNSSQTVTDTTTTSSVFESESTPSSSSSSISTTNNDGSTSSGSTDVSAPTSVMRNSLSENPPSSTSSTDTITTTEITVTDTTTGETTPTEVPTTITSQSTTSATDTTSVESQITTSEAPETSATTASTSPTTVTATTVSEPTTATSETATTATTISEPTTATDTTSETATTVSEPTTVTSETATTVSEPTTVTDATSGTATTVSEPTTVTDTASETVTTISEPTTITSSDVTTTDSGAGSSTMVGTESQTASQTQTETATLTESSSTILTETGTLSEAQTATETISAARSDTSVTSTLRTDSGSSSRPISTVISSASSSGSSPSTLVASTVTDVLTDVNTSNLDILTQNSLPTAEALSLTSRGVTFTTTEFTTSTRPDGRVTTIPTMTRTVTSTGNPTYTLQPNEFEKNKGTIAGVIVAAVVVAVIGIFVGVWYCRRRRGRAAGRRSSLSPFAEVAPSVLIPGHPSPAGDRSLHSQEWRPPLVGEVGDDDEDRNALRSVMSQRSSTSGHILPVSYRDPPASPPVDSSDVTSLVSSRQPSTIQFGTSLLSFDGVQQTNAISRFSDSSSMEGGVRTASLISFSAEPTPIDSRFSHASSTSGTIPIMSPFADSFSTQEAARNSYWGTTRPSTLQSSLSGEDSAPKRSESMGSQRSARAQSITSSERGWKEIEVNENVPRPPGRASVPIHDVVVPAVNPFEVENTVSLMSQMSLLNPPTRPPFHTTLTALIHQSRPPMLPEIPAVASPALTDDSFHPEGLLADHLYVQGKSADNASRGSRHSLLDHVDYSRPIVDSPRDSAAYDGDITFRMSRGTETSIEEGGVFESSENPFRDPVPNDEDLFNDVSPVLTMLRRGTASKASIVNVSGGT